MFNQQRHKRMVVVLPLNVPFVNTKLCVFLVTLGLAMRYAQNATQIRLETMVATQLGEKPFLASDVSTQHAHWRQGHRAVAFKSSLVHSAQTVR